MIKIIDASLTEVFSNREVLTPDVSGVVSEIIRNVRARGDRALTEYSRKFDGVTMRVFEVKQKDIDDAYRFLDPVFKDILNRAAENIRAFHMLQVRQGFEVQKGVGCILGQKITPIEKVGIYVPGGTAAYPSTVLMNAIPAKIAGCSEIIMVTPPSGENGGVDPNILAAAKIAGVDRVFRVGGAQAVAALAYGTESIPRVDKITGPGNAFVAEAKKQVFGDCDIDMIAGPSEILIIADISADPVCLAADMLSQAEHDKNASSVLILTNMGQAEAVSRELEKQIALLPRAKIARASIDNNGRIYVTSTLETAVKISNKIAPEHLELCVDLPEKYLPLVKNAGSIFLGKSCPEALGDYFAGPNHTLPTGGRARFSSPLSVDDFIKKSSYIYYTPDALSAQCGDIAFFAEKEGLSAHARSVTIREERKVKKV